MSNPPGRKSVAYLQSDDEYKQLKVSVAQKIRELRESKGWLQKDLAEKLGVTRVRVTQMETVDPPITLISLFQVAQVFEVHITELLSCSIERLPMLETDEFKDAVRNAIIRSLQNDGIHLDLTVKIDGFPGLKALLAEDRREERKEKRSKW